MVSVPRAAMYEIHQITDFGIPILRLRPAYLAQIFYRSTQPVFLVTMLCGSLLWAVLSTPYWRLANPGASKARRRLLGVDSVVP